VGEAVSMLNPSFNGSVGIELRTDRQSSDGGAFALREILEHTGIVDWLAARLHDPRNPKLITYSVDEILRTVLLQLCQGWGDQADTDHLRDDPVLALCGSDARGQTPLDSSRPSQPTLSRLLGILCDERNLAVLHRALMRLSGTRLRSLNRGHRHRRVTIDFDGVPIPVHGEQAGSAYNSDAGERVYYPLRASIAETGDLLDARLREGDVGPAADAAEWIPAVIAAARRELCQVALARLDAGFTGDPTLRALEAEGIPYLGRLRNNAALERQAAPHLRRPPGRPPREPREWAIDQSYQAGSWEAPRRVILVVQERPDDLFLHRFWLVTNLDPERYPPQAVLALYRRRGWLETPATFHREPPPLIFTRSVVPGRCVAQSRSASVTPS